MRYCSEDAPRTGEKNVNLNKNTSKNTALNKIFQITVLYKRCTLLHIKFKADISLPKLQPYI